MEGMLIWGYHNDMLCMILQSNCGLKIADIRNIWDVVYKLCNPEIMLKM